MSFNRAQRVLLGVICTAFVASAEPSRLRKAQENPQVPMGFQSGPDPGATYGGNIIYRPDSNRIYVTGASNGNYFKSADAVDRNSNVAADTTSCFLGIADMPSADNAGTPPSWVHAQQWETSVPEACNVIHVDQNPVNLPENNTRIAEKLYLLGFTSNNGLMEPLRIQSAFPAEQYGMIMDVDILKNQPDSTDFTTTFWGGRLLQDGPVQYPIDMTVDDNGNIYVVSLQTFETAPISRNTRPTQVAKQMVDPLLTPYGSEYNMLIEQFLYDNPGYDDGVGVPEDPSNVQIDTTIVDNWRKPFSPENGSGGAIVAGVAYLGGVLVVVGTTNGHSQVFGNELAKSMNHTDTSMDAFVTKIVPDSGKYYQFVADNGAPAAESAQPMHKRSATSFMSIDYKDDYVMGMCYSPADPDNFYLVGTTEGQMDRTINQLVQGEIHAFLMKVNVWTLLPAWTKQIGGDPIKKDVVRGLACAVTDDGQDVYMAGIVENGGSLSLYQQNSFGGDDIFLLQVDAGDGRLVFLRQIGTSGNDRLSPDGVATDAYGNAILMGNTDGSFYRSRQFDQESEKSDDVFIMSVMRGTGDYKEPQVPDASESAPSTATSTTTTEQPSGETTPSEQEPADDAASTVEQGLSDAETATNEQAPEPQQPQEEEHEKETPSEDPMDQLPAPAGGSLSDAFGDKPMIYTNIGSVEHPHEEEEGSPKSRQRYGLVMFFILIAIVGLITGLLAYRQMTTGDTPTDRDAVLGYLSEFDVDDIDLKQSATGGYHCSYTNDLAHGINARAVSREGLFGPMGFSPKSGTTNDPLLQIHGQNSHAEGEIHFSDEPELDDLSSIGSGIGTPGRHSTDAALIDDYDGINRPSSVVVL
ncbi:expressed unknown protein [Seminavis robusta]|uniref:Uncharacterized protein n=1 Tax=Seminavis robusta TaxID=568900 RepID=A0A9N8HTH8_9STRA|nr:expressed unknown protein [Seminavis robusta]|eukprot:Sro1883_g303440.1 n/a (864) ;mRNA; r:13216-15807